jgi:hypothetical protein
MIKDYGSQNQLLDEIKRLQRISERQSAMLAQALKEKNDARDGKGDRVERLIQRLLEKDVQLGRTQQQLDIAERKLKDIYNSAKVFFRAVGV